MFAGLPKEKPVRGVSSGTPPLEAQRGCALRQRGRARRQLKFLHLPLTI